MMAKCEACGWEDTVEYERDYDACRCSECGARYEVEADADCVDGRYVDRSVPGKRINTERETHMRQFIEKHGGAAPAGARCHTGQTDPANLEDVVSYEDKEDDGYTGVISLTVGVWALDKEDAKDQLVALTRWLDEYLVKRASTIPNCDPLRHVDAIVEEVWETGCISAPRGDAKDIFAKVRAAAEAARATKREGGDGV